MGDRSLNFCSHELEHDACGIGAVVNINGKRDHRIVEQALDIVEKLEHRAGKDADGKTGDGVGIMVQISDTFFRKVFRQYGWQPEEAGDFGIGMFFLPQNPLHCSQAKKMMEVIAKKEGVDFIGWRQVPVVENVLGQRGKKLHAGYCPGIFQETGGNKKRAGF